MTFKNWLSMFESGTTASAVSAPSTGSSATLSANINNPPVPKKLLGDSPVRRKWMSAVGKTGLAGPLLTVKFNKN
jgi:hypothetical protein